MLLLDSLEEYRDTIADLSDYIKIGPPTSTVLNNRGLAYYEIGRIEEALEDFERAIEVDSTNAIPHINKAELFKRTGRPNEAVESCSAAIVTNKDVTFLRFRAYLLIDLERLDEALADLDQAVELEPTHQYTIEKREEIRQRLDSTP